MRIQCWAMVAVAATMVLVAGECRAGEPAAGAKAAAIPAEARRPDDGKLRIIVFGAHPDDCEIKAGGVGALWAKQGCLVKFVSVTNGDIGHWKMNRDDLAKRRLADPSGTQCVGFGCIRHQLRTQKALLAVENVERFLRGQPKNVVMAARS